MARVVKFPTFLLSIAVASCAEICVTKSVKVEVSEKTITFKQSKIPCYKIEEFEKAAKYTIEAIYSEDFSRGLANHIENNIGSGPQVAAWKGVSSDETVMRMREAIDGAYAETYGGTKGLWLSVIYGNIAYDGTKDGPIKLNRWSLRGRGIGKIANTIAHEVAHRIGLTHPGIKISQDVANKEPPYVIGDIIERIVIRRIEIESSQPILRQQ